MQHFQTPRPTPGYQQPYLQQMPSNYKAPQPVEVYVMADHANNSIPPEIREQFQCDEKGRVLFFTAPPLNVEQPLTKDGRPLGHSARYLAAKAKKEALKAAKRKAGEGNTDERERAAKKAKANEEERLKKAVSDLNAKALRALGDQLAMTTKSELTAIFNGQAQEGIEKIVDQLTAVQKETMQKELERELHALEIEERKRVTVSGMTARLEEKY